MTSLALVVGAVLAVLAVVFVARPFLREPAPADDRLDAVDDAVRRRLELAEERDRALAALKELELDHRTGKISDEDYRALVGPLRRRAARALRALDPPEPARQPEPYPPPGELDPPQPPEIPEPYPPPGELDPPTQPPIPEPYPEQALRAARKNGGRPLDAGRTRR
jgi:hypothetical protein